MSLESRQFFATPRVVMGQGAVQKVGPLLSELGARAGTVMVVTDTTLAKLGLANRIQTHLSTEGLESALFSEIAGEPTEEIATAVVNATRTVRPSAVIGVGGGSALDMAKLAAVLVTNAGALSEYFAGKTLGNRPVPLVLIPTTAGTGAESSRNAVVTRQAQKAFIGSPWLVPAAAILDPELTLSLPPNVTAWTGMDALSHCMEAILSTYSTPLTDAIAVRGIQLIRENLPRAYREGTDLSARTQMQVAAFFGGFALNAGMVLGHSMAYTLANRLHLAHGLSCALALPPAIAYNANAAPEKMALLAIALGIEGDGGAVVREVRALGMVLGIPAAWQSLGLKREDLPALVEECMTRYPRPNNPKPLDREALQRLYQASWEGRDEVH